MKDPQSIGLNRTGIQMSPIDAAKMMETMDSTPPDRNDPQSIVDFRGRYLREAEPIGTVPPPGTLKGAASTTLQKLKGGHPVVFIDKLGERLAFERTGVRLYNLLITKCRERPGDLKNISMATLENIRDEELNHFTMLTQIMEDIGADPTAVTPAADVAAVISQGILQVLSDPRTTVPQSLEAILVVELTDNDAWSMLTKMAQDYGMDDIAQNFQEAEEAEQRHLSTIRALVAASVDGIDPVMH